MIDLKLYLPAKRKQTASGWYSFNAPCCVHNGESADRRGRGGIIFSDTGWSYSCFNCGFKTSFVLGRNLSFKARKLLSWMQVPPEEIERINLESLRHRSIQGILDDRAPLDPQPRAVSFAEASIDEVIGEIITQDSAPDLWRYLQQRAVPTNYPCFAAQSGRPGVVIPFTHNNKLVGHSTRFLDDRKPKYINDTQPGYVFGTDLQEPNWQHAIVVEGVFDALAISGLAVLHADISDAQAQVIRRLEREITVVPDRDAAGMRLADRAVELGWAVSMPEWPDCKDVNDAVQKYGQLVTVLMIMQARETNRLKIELRRREVVKRIRN
jgi:hypothetical protein